MIKKTLLFIRHCTLLITLLFFSGLLNAQTENVEKILNSDGTIKTGLNGSYDVTGYTLEYGENNEPILVNPERLNKEKGTSTVTWNSFGSGYNGTSGQVRAILVVGDDIYFGGDFKAVDDINASGIVKWSTVDNTWSALGSGVSGWVGSLVLSSNGENLYVGGSFNTAGGVPANNIAMLNLSSGTWSALGTGLGSYPLALAIIGTNLYAGGAFTKLGDNSTVVNYIAKWDGSSWSALSTGMNNNVYTLTVISGNLYAGGYFTLAGGIPANKIAVWNVGTSTWFPLSSEIVGVYSYVFVLATDGTNLYAGGTFTTAGGVTANNIAKWNGSSWSELGSGTGSEVHAITIDGSNIYAGGNNNANRIAKWNGSSWSALGSGVGSTFDRVNAIVLKDSKLYVGGIFSTAGGVTANNIAKWDNTNWSSITAGGTNGVNGQIYAIALSEDNIYIGGDFTIAGGTTVNRIARWNKTSSEWYALGTGLSGTVYALAVIGDELYVGGSFTDAGDVAAADYIAKWNGTAWFALGSGVDNTVRTLAVSGTNLYAGGEFYTAGGDYVGFIAKWNAEDGWSALDYGVESNVYALAVSGEDLYVGGEFTRAGELGMTFNRIAKWNAEDGWSALTGGSINGVSDVVYALAVIGTDLYVGGHFTKLGDNTTDANRIAKWNGTAWSSLDSGVDYYVSALAVSGNDLYVGGAFSTAGGVASNRIAKWNETNGWTTLMNGSVNGVSSNVNALLLDVSSQKMIVGGDFITAGSKGVYRIAAFTDADNPFPVDLTTFTANVAGNKINLYWSTATEVNNYGFYLERKLKDNNWEEITFIAGNGNSQITNEYNYIDNIEAEGLIQYRLKQVDIDGGFKYSSLIEVILNLPNQYSLTQNYPNPFNPETTISYSIAKPGKVKIVIFDILGKEISTLVNENKESGNHTVQFNGSNLTSGIYFYKIESGEFSAVKKMVLLK